MSASKAKRQKFFVEHPICCFCSGGEPATTQDHIPGRALFERRIWPEGYLFPACNDCNRESSDNELAVALFASMSETKRHSDTQLQELRKRFDAFKRQCPNLAQRIKTYSRSGELSLLKKQNVPAWNATTGLQRKVMVFPSEALNMCNEFGIKLGKALHYMHAKTIVPVDSVVSCKVFTNADMEHLDEEVIQKINSLPDFPKIAASKKPLNDQFTYKYVITEDKRKGAFTVMFGKDALLFLIVIDSSKDVFDQISKEINYEENLEVHI